MDRAGRTTTFVYDAAGRLTQTLFPDDTGTSTAYDDLGRVTFSVDARGTTNAFGYDAAGRRISVTNAYLTSVQMVSGYTYDANGNQTIFSDASNHATTNVYDALNRVVQVKYANGTKSGTAYDVAGRRVAETNQDNVVTQFGYDGAGRLTSVTDALLKVTRYEYDEAGNQTAQVDALLRTNRFAYDNMGRRTAQVMPDPALVERFSYDGLGNLVRHTNFNGQIITNEYDVMNRLKTRSAGGGYKIGYTYTATGQRESMTDSSGSYGYTYDERDRLRTYTTPAGRLYYDYDTGGNVTNLFSPRIDGASVGYEYDALGRLRKVGDEGGSTSYGFDAVGNLRQVQYPNGVTNVYQYDSLNRLTNLSWKLNTTPLASFFYQLGLSGHRTNLSETVNAVSRTYAWRYDNLYRLTNETVAGSAPTGVLGYAYDAVGNGSSWRWSSKLPGGRLGNANTQLQNTRIAAYLQTKGWRIRNGGGQGPEERIPGVGGGRQGETWVDITVEKNVGGTVKILRIQTVSTLRNGAPTPNELAAASRIRAAFPEDKLLLVPKAGEGKSPLPLFHGDAEDEE